MPNSEPPPSPSQGLERGSNSSFDNGPPGVFPDDAVDAPNTHNPDMLLSEIVKSCNEQDKVDAFDDNEHEIKQAVCVKTRCASCRNRCFTCCKPCMTAFNPLPTDPSLCDKLKYSLLCPPHGKLAKLLALSLSVLLVWGTLWGLSPKTQQALPGGTFFGILALLVLCVIGGSFTLLIKLPPLLGMLIVGFALRNIPVIKIIVTGIDPRWSSSLRTIALVVILLRAGLGLDPKALRKLSCVVVRLAFLPCIVECITVAIVTHLLMGFPWIWGFMLGFVLAAVSPAVVVPSLLSLQERGYGTDEGIPTLVIAAASIDDVLAISGFGVVLGIAFSTGDIGLAIVRGPLEALIGVVYGVVFGFVIWYIPHKKHANLVLFRTLLLIGGGMFVMFGSNAVDFPGAGALGVLTMAFVAAFQWRREGWTDDQNPVSDIIAKLWILFQPLLFGLIGAEVDLATLNGSTIGLGVATLFIGLFFRIIASFLAVFGSGLNLKEKLFIPIAWLPKATVQAAIGSVALDTARKQNASPEIIDLGTKVLTIAVLVIVITAPIGAAAISLVGPRLLKLSKKRDLVPEVDVESDAEERMHLKDVEDDSTKV